MTKVGWPLKLCSERAIISKCLAFARASRSVSEALPSLIPAKLQFRRDVRFPFPSFPRKRESIVDTVKVDPRLRGDDEGWSIRRDDGARKVFAGMTVYLTGLLLPKCLDRF